MRSKAPCPYVTAISQHGFVVWPSPFTTSRRASASHTHNDLGHVLTRDTTDSIPCFGGAGSEDGNATPADRNVQPSTLTSFQQLCGRVVQHWHSAEKYADNRYTSAENSTRKSTSPISDFPLPLLSTCFSLFLPSGSTARGIAKAIAA